MCGIASNFAYHYASPPIDREELRVIRDAMRDRGPDGKGEWFSADGRVGLAHRRLSIIDLSENGHQPMTNADQTVVISFNGEIYNYRSLRADLENKGHVFRSQSDTEVLLKLYEVKGEAMVNDLRGMFAFVIWDQKKEALFLARDAYGIKPLYYADDGWQVRIASQVKALRAGRKISSAKEPAGVIGFMLTGSVPEPHTLYQEIHSLPAGSSMWVTKRGTTEPRSFFSMADIYRSAQSQNIGQSPVDSVTSVKQSLLESVRAHFESDVPVGIFLSSGIDSSVLTGLAHEAKVGPLITLTAAFEHLKSRGLDETVGARSVSALYQTAHAEHLFDDHAIASEFSRIMAHMDQPSIDGMNTYFISLAASRQRLKVALSGLGADELFGGYPSFQSIPLMNSLSRFPSAVPGLGVLTRQAARCILPKKISPKMASLFEYGASTEGAYFLRRGLFMPWELTAFFDQDFIREGLKRLNLFSRMKSELAGGGLNTFAKISILESSFYMRNQLLRDADWAGMAHGIEIRVPWADATLFKQVAPFLLKDTKPNKKHFLAQSVSQALPQEILHRKKTGFTLPLEVLLENRPQLDAWKKIPQLKKPCHASRRLAYVVLNQFMET